MAVDVVYEGIVLQRGAEVKDTPAGLFVALEAPMPVGSALGLEDAGVKRAVRVARVHEGVGPGVIVVAEAGSSLPKADSSVGAANVPPPAVPVHVEEPPRFRDTMNDVAPVVAPKAPDAPPPDDTRKTIEMSAIPPEELKRMEAAAAPAEAAPAPAEAAPSPVPAEAAPSPAEDTRKTTVMQTVVVEEDRRTTAANPVISDETEAAGGEPERNGDGDKRGLPPQRKRKKTKPRI